MEKYDCPAAAHNAVAYMAPYIARYSPLAFGLAVIHGNQSIAKLALQQICTYDCGIPGDLGVVQQCSAWLANIPSHLFRKIPPDVIHQVLLFQQQYLTNTAVEPHLATFSHWSDITDGLVVRAPCRPCSRPRTHPDLPAPPRPAFRASSPTSAALAPVAPAVLPVPVLMLAFPRRWALAGERAFTRRARARFRQGA